MCASHRKIQSVENTDRIISVKQHVVYKGRKKRNISVIEILFEKDKKKNPK